MQTVIPRAATPQEAPVVLSPFEVVADNQGYHATNTTSGTRLNSRIDDLGASITVITKEQMADFALLDINDIFNYEAGTEGAGNFTDFSFDQNGQQIDNTQLDPQTANRIRGLGAANTTLRNFETSGRVPIDPTEIDGVEISRGPNSGIFGVGEPSGTVNSIPASANLARNQSQVSLRADSNEGYRATLDFNRVLRKGTLALRGTTVFQHDGYHLKPSGTDTRRFTGMVKFRPYQATTLTASYLDFRLHGNRPNVSTPAQAITGWVAAGSPTWDPITATVKVNGVPAGSSTTPYFNTTSLNYSQIYVDQAGISYWGTGRATTSNDPNNGNQSVRLMGAVADPTGFLAAQPLFPDYPTTNRKAVYDWSSVNLAAANRIEDRAQNASVVLDHTFLATPRQTLALQLGWFRESTERLTHNPIGSSTGAVNISQVLQIDVNERLLDGRPNPYFLRPFVGATIPNRFSLPLDRDTYRAQLAYRLKASGETGWRRWLGQHQFSGYAEYKTVAARSFQYRDVIVDNHSWLGPGVARGAAGGAGGGLPAPPILSNGFFRYYVGDNAGRNVDYGSTAYTYGPYAMSWGNGVTGQFVQEPVALGLGAANTAGTGNSLTLLKTRGGIVQSLFAGGRVVTTFGLRYDERYTKGPASFKYLPDGVNVDWAASNGWENADWMLAKGPTRTAGLVLKPFPWLSLHGNRSDSFKPAGVAYGMHFQVLPDPSGKGEDAGFSLNLLQGRLALRFNQHKTTSVNSRNGQSAVFGTRTYRMDFSAATSNVFALQRKAAEWVQAAAAARGQVLSATEFNQQVAAIMKVPVEYISEPAYLVTATDDIIAKGHELEIHYSPTVHWLLKMNVTEQQSINANMSKELSTWLAERLAVWKTITDPLLGRPWFTERYNNSTSAEQYLAGNVTSGLALAQALEGKSRPQIRRYRMNLLTNFNLAGLTEHRFLKACNVGGALRWEDKGAIGYYGLQQLPAIITDLDPHRPVYDQSHVYADLLLGYKVRLFGARVPTKFQLNIRNLNESGRLQPIAADPTGNPTAYRIIEPRLFIFSATFSL